MPENDKIRGKFMGILEMVQKGVGAVIVNGVLGLCHPVGTLSALYDCLLH